MAIRPRLDFYRIYLKHKENRSETTFKDFALEELGAKEPLTKNQYMQLLLDYFISSLDDPDKSRSERIGKEVKLVNDNSNVYINSKPKINSSFYSISGVINGGQFKGKRILSQEREKNGKKSTTNSSLRPGDSVLNYYYIYLYLPLDSYKGYIMIHSNSPTDSITKLLTDHFLTRTFRGNNFHNPIIEKFAPDCFQETYRRDSVIDSFSFRTESLNGIEVGKIDTNLYEFEVIARPKNRQTSMRESDGIFKNLKSIPFLQKKLDEFEEKKLIVRESTSDTQKTFEWNSKDQDFAIVCYLQGKIILEDDGAPNMQELDNFCHNLFKEEILPTMRKDLFITDENS